MAIQTNVEGLVQDNVLPSERRGENCKVKLTDHLLLALHDYYGGIAKDKLAAMPPPDWDAVLAIHDKLKGAN